jgi:glycosyltransferase involved in cell wall biosynthesis
MSGRTVLFPISTNGLGGAHVLPAMLVGELHRASRWDVRACLVTQGEHAALFESQGLPTDCLGMTRVQREARSLLLTRLRYYGAAWYLRTYGQVVPYLRRVRPDILHIHNAPDLFTWGFVGKLLKIPVVWHVHTYHQRRLNPLTFRLCDHMIFVSDASRQHFDSVATLPPHTTVHNGVDVERFAAAGEPEAARARLGLDPRRLTLGFVGQLTSRKRPEWAVRAAIDLLAAGHDLQMIVVGEDRSHDQSHQARLRAMIHDAGCQDRVHLLGQRDDVASVMAALDIFLFASEEHGEAFPLVVLEAMASGTAVVSTRSAGVPEAVTDGETGLLAVPDDYDHFLQQTTRLVRDEALRAGLRCSAHQEARERFSIERCSEAVVDVYEGITQEARGRAA